jgi:hypothetical protein
MITRCPTFDYNSVGLLDILLIPNNYVNKIDYGKNIELL